jgi:Mrp family chromosome partitioning ATPase
MTTLNQAFIKVYAKQGPGSKSDLGAIRMGPQGVQLRVDAGTDAVRAPEIVAPAIDAIAGGQDISGQEASAHIVTSGQVAMASGSTDSMVTVEAERVPALDQFAQGTEQYAASCVRSPLLGAEIHWPAVSQSLVREASESLRAAGMTLVQAVEEGMRYLAITSAVTGVGVTTTAICLARAAAQQGLRVALVDAHFADPQLAGEMHFKAFRSWHAAAGSQQLPVPLTKEGVTFYPLQLDSDEDLTDWTRPTLLPSLQQVAAGHDLVVLDVGSVLVAWGYGFSRIVKNVINGVVMVRDRRQADAFAVESAMDRLRRAGLEVVAADNFVS